MGAETFDPLSASVSEYAIEYPGATPTRIMRELDLDSTYRAQVEHFCVVTRYSLFAEANDCEKGEDLRLQTLEWSDVADWEIPAEDLPPEK
ncbi:hypothetical protein [Halocatena marina]|uniref:hypothetical protein n=1 Tax=Halocatena marina TaxID=2934937 RepID=UPI00200D703E|nr:hypothetical protein [Halocatena marina]